MNKAKLTLLLLATLLMAACGDSNEDERPTQALVTFTLGLPDGIEEGTLTNLSLVLREQNTGIETSTSITLNADRSFTQAVALGFYSVTLNGQMTFQRGDYEKHVSVQASKESLVLTAETATLTLQLYMTSEPEPDPVPEPLPEDAYRGFVLSEIFCAGSATPQGTYYYADKYFVIYNNTDHVLYADSLAIAESDFLTVMKEEYTPDIMERAMAIKALYMIPGTGKDHPVEPGGHLLIVDNALNHKAANPNSWNMMTADFEWYDESLNPEYSDIDNPDVANLTKVYAKTLTMWSPHTQGFTAFALAHMGTTVEAFLEDYLYEYEYHLVGATGEADMEGTCFQLPNEWIVDAVNMSVPGMWQWNVVSPALDRGWTYCAEFGWDDSRYNKSVRRKVASRDGSRAILQDTNNSTDDFEPRTEADPFFNYQ